MRVSFNAHVAESLIIANATVFIVKNTPYTYVHTPSGCIKYDY